jgi:acetylornithine deacetylase/succinyl-diaminopimelate desuccinylase-like protein
VIAACEPNVSDPDHEIMRHVLRNAEDVLKTVVVRNMRVGFSDARFYRQHRVPAVVYGPTPHNMGGPDEHVTLNDLFAVFYVHALAAFDFLSRR